MWRGTRFDAHIAYPNLTPRHILGFTDTNNRESHNPENILRKLFLPIMKNRMNRACISQFANLHEHNQHASSIRPLKINLVRMKPTISFPKSLYFLLIALVSCQGPSRNIKEEIYSITADLVQPDSVANFAFTPDRPVEIPLADKIVSLRPSELFEVSHYLPLESSDSSLLGRIEKIIFRDSLIFIKDDTGKRIAFFDHRGKFRGNVQHAGKGPGEYYRIMDFDVKDSLIYILDDVNAKIFVYTYDGRWVHTRNMAVIFSNFIILPDGNFLMSTGGGQNEFIPALQQHDYLLGNPDSLITHKGFLRNESRQKMAMYENPRTLSHYNDTILLMPKYGQTVYQLTPDKRLRERYKIRFKKPLTEEALESADPGYMGRDMVANGYQYLDQYWLETSQYTLFMYLYPENGKHLALLNICFYSKERKKTFTYDSVDPDYSFLLYRPPFTTYNDRFVSILWPNDILDRKKLIEYKNANNPEVLRILNQLKEEDNPVLMFFKIKENCPLF